MNAAIEFSRIKHRCVQCPFGLTKNLVAKRYRKGKKRKEGNWSFSRVDKEFIPNPEKVWCFTFSVTNAQESIGSVVCPCSDSVQTRRHNL